MAEENIPSQKHRDTGIPRYFVTSSVVDNSKDSKNSKKDEDVHDAGCPSGDVRHTGSQAICGVGYAPARVGPGYPSSPLSIYFLIFPPLYFSLSFIGFTYFLLLSIPSLSTRIVPLRFQAGGRRRRPNLGLVCVLLCYLFYLYSLVRMDCSVLFYLV